MVRRKVKKKGKKNKSGSTLRPMANNYYHIYSNSVLDQAKLIVYNTYNKNKGVVKFITFGFPYSKQFIKNLFLSKTYGCTLPPPPPPP